MLLTGAAHSVCKEAAWSGMQRGQRMEVLPLDSLWSRMAWKYLSGQVGPVKTKQQCTGHPGLGLRHVSSVEWL